MVAVETDSEGLSSFGPRNRLFRKCPFEKEGRLVSAQMVLLYTSKPEVLTMNFKEIEGTL